MNNVSKINTITSLPNNVQEPTPYHYLGRVWKAVLIGAFDTLF